VGSVVPLPADFGIALDRSVRTTRSRRILAGGHPQRVLRLTAAGLAAVDHLVGSQCQTEAGRRLGRRMVDQGLAHPRLPRCTETSEVTVVVPVRDRAAALDRCLTALGGHVRIVVVDDGSYDAVAIAEVCCRGGATLVRREQTGGPAAARNSALREVETDLIAFLDSDCVPAPGWLSGLVGHFADPLVGAVAPRVQPLKSCSSPRALERFLATRSPLDMGPEEGRVAPGTRVPYVPSAALVVRCRALGGRPFDEDLRYGEDVDLVWRLHDAGWRLRYEPSVIVEHEEPASWPAMLARRTRYGSAAAALARRHPRRLAPLQLRPWPAAASGLLIMGLPLQAGALMAAHTAVLARRTRRTGVPATWALFWCVGAVWRTYAAIGRAATTFAAPVLALGMTRRRTRGCTVCLAAAPALETWMRRRPRMDPVRWTFACLVDDVAYGIGAWRASVAERSLSAVVPSWRPPDAS